MQANYNPKDFEKKWWKYWEDEELFHAVADPKKKPYTILMPPPNVTSRLHMGHGTCYTFQDILIRWKRMLGYSALWLPGTDHAGIATQMMVEKDLLKQENKTKEDLGREAFLKRCQEWKDTNGDIIYEQFKTIGFSADYKRKAYTMDPDLSKSVREIFVKLYNDGLIYRGERLVNWDPVLRTAISDDEIENKEIDGHLYHFYYPVEDSDQKILIATTRPETMLGDTAVAVHPDDERYQDLIGKKVKLPFSGRLIPIVADEYVKQEFGSGAVKITPAHDPNDFEIGKRHQLEFINILNDDATLASNTPADFQGLDRFEARKLIVKKLKELGLYKETKSYRHSVPHSDRSKAIIEPKLSKQWYVKMDGLAKAAADKAREGQLHFYPDNWQKTYLYWLDNIQDWCISRQLWWGHQIPIWYCQNCDKTTTGTEDPTNCAHCGSTDLKQDEDVLDTWFSSWLWPISPFGWPEKSAMQKKDFEYFYPSDVLITAPEIIFLWVARMIMVGLYTQDKIPFKDMYFSAVVTDKDGVKFSKTLGNGIDPMEVIDEYGADAVRYSGTAMAPLGGRIMMAKDDFEAGSRFANKIWNATRFILNTFELDHTTQLKPLSEIEFDLKSCWLLDRLHTCAYEVNQNLTNYRINEASKVIYHFIWDDLCDWGLECSKIDDDKQRSASILVYALDQSLRMLSPIMPFICEELWQKLPAHPDLTRQKSLCISDYPNAENISPYPEESKVWDQILALIQSVRSSRQQLGIPPKTQLKAFIESDPKFIKQLENENTYICKLAAISQLSRVSNSIPEKCICATGKGFKVYLQVGDLVDFDKERSRLAQEKTRLEKIIQGIDKKLSNKNFVERAPKDVIDQTKAQHDNLSSQLTAVDTSLAALSS